MLHQRGQFHRCLLCPDGTFNDEFGLQCGQQFAKARHPCSDGKVDHLHTGRDRQTGIGNNDFVQVPERSNKRTQVAVQKGCAFHLDAYFAR